MPREHSYGIIPVQKREGIWHVYIIKLHAGHWGFPKGHAEEGEDPLAAAMRELQEETGLFVTKLLTETPLTEQYRCMKLGQKVQKRVSYFLAEVSGEVELQTAEVAEGKWVSLQKVEKSVTYPEAKRVAKEAMKWMQ